MEPNMGGRPKAADPFDGLPDHVKAKFMKPHTVFAPGNRIKMNIVPMFLNLFAPWGVFTACCGLTSGWLMYSEPGLVMMASLFMLGIAAVSVYRAYQARQRDPEPTWYSYTALSLLIAVVTGLVCGYVVNFRFLAKPYFEIKDLKAVHQVDVQYERGQNMMDAGVLYFAHDNSLDGRKSWHFMHHTQYCVAPVTKRGQEPDTQSYDFWAVGEDCCSMSASDFRCGEWSSSAARSGIRVLDDKKLPFYRLAVQQAETLYGIQAAHPIFFEWSQDPLKEVNSWNMKAFRNYLYLLCTSFLVSLVALVVALSRFSFIGRAESVYEYDILDDPTFKSGGYAGQGGGGPYGSVR